MAGLGYIIVILFIVALLCFAGDYTTNPSYSWAQASLLCTLQFVWQMTLGPLTYVVVCETPSTKLRSKTIALATMIDAATGLVTSVIGPYLLNPGAANAGAKIEFLYGGISIISLTWCFFRLPETKDRTFEELDILFERRVSAREFKKYVIDQSDEE
jgi:MFS transporter, SP family, general alpha glucoside:H+ symporter